MMHLSMQLSLLTATSRIASFLIKRLMSLMKRVLAPGSLARFLHLKLKGLKTNLLRLDRRRKPLLVIRILSELLSFVMRNENSVS